MTFRMSFFAFLSTLLVCKWFGYMPVGDKAGIPKFIFTSDQARYGSDSSDSF